MVLIRSDQDEVTDAETKLVVVRGVKVVDGAVLDNFTVAGGGCGGCISSSGHSS